VIVNSKQERAHYIVLLDHEGCKELISRDNKVVVFNKDGDSIMSRSTRILGNAVKDTCLPSPRIGQSSLRKQPHESKNKIAADHQIRAVPPDLP
jgi:hypothetical protein